MTFAKYKEGKEFTARGDSTDYETFLQRHQLVRFMAQGYVT
jgi:hypothetical protein